MARKTGKTTRKDRDPEVKVSQDAPKKKSVGPIQFLNQVRNEGRKVTWTSRNETMVSTGMVLVFVAIMSVFFMLADWAMRTLVQFLLGL